jgi:hypothetical protein
MKRTKKQEECLAMHTVRLSSDRHERREKRLPRDGQEKEENECETSETVCSPVGLPHVRDDPAGQRLDRGKYDRHDTEHGHRQCRIGCGAAAILI